MSPLAARAIAALCLSSICFLRSFSTAFAQFLGAAGLFQSFSIGIGMTGK
jgi:hypothetical protein